MYTHLKKNYRSVLYLSALLTKAVVASSSIGADVGLYPSSAFSTSTLRTTDSFDFILTRFPQIKESASSPFKHCSEELAHYTKLQSLIDEKGKEAQEVLLEGGTTVLSRGTYTWFGQAYENYVKEQVHPMLDTLRHDHPLHENYGVFFEHAYNNHTVLEDLVLASKYLYQVVKDEGGGTVLFLGRTPCLVKLAYERLLNNAEENVQQRAVHLNFSGHPDALTNREHSFFQSLTNIARDVVTPDKLAHYFSYMDTKSILEEKTLFIVDILGSGGGLNSFLRVIHAYFQQHDIQLPRLMFLNLTQDMNWGANRHPFTTFEKTGERANKGILILLPHPEKNIKEFKLEACSVPVFEKMIGEMLDQDMFQEFLVEGIQYPAQRWTPEFDALRDQGGAYHKPLYEHLTKEIDALLLASTPK